MYPLFKAIDLNIYTCTRRISTYIIQYITHTCILNIQENMIRMADLLS